MSKKGSAPRKRKRGTAQRKGQHARGSRAPRVAKRQLAPIAVAVAVGVGVVAVVVVWTMIGSGGSETDLPNLTGYGAAGPADCPPARPPSTGPPINDVDPATGKPVTTSSPTLVYKGHVIGFCCGSSGGYRGGWARMSEAKKDAFVSRYLGK